MSSPRDGVDTSSVVTGLFYGGGLASCGSGVRPRSTVALAVFVVSMALMYGSR